jgi:hypothetical protein
MQYGVKHAMFLRQNIMPITLSISAKLKEIKINKNWPPGLRPFMPSNTNFSPIILETRKYSITFQFAKFSREMSEAPLTSFVPERIAAEQSKLRSITSCCTKMYVDIEPLSVGGVFR